MTTSNKTSTPSLKKQTLSCRPKTSKPFTEPRKKYYFTTGRKVNPEILNDIETILSTPYKIPEGLNSLEEVKQFWKDEKDKKIKERRGSYVDKHNYKSRLDILWKTERLHVPEDFTLPGKSVTEDIDPDFFTIATNRPIKEKKNLREYLKDIRNCFLTRLKTGFHLDEVLLMEERHINEKKKLNEVRQNFLSCLKGFETFLEEDYASSSTLLETANEESKKSKEKLKIITGLKEELKDLEADVLVVEERWRNCQMFQKFLYIIAPSEWRKVYDPDFGRKDVHPSIFDREFPGETKVELEAKISKFKEDVRNSRVPALYFTEPQQLLNILEDLEKNNQIALVHCKELDYPAESMASEVEKAKVRFEEDQRILEEEIKYLENLVKQEEDKAKMKEKKLEEIGYGLFKDLIGNEEYLTITSYVEDTYEDAVAPTDGSLDIIEMIKEIELKQENLLLALDILPNDIMVQTTRNFYKEQKRELREAKKAEKKVHQMEMLLKGLSKSLEPPKKGFKERRIAPRSLPPEELMYEYVQPKILSKEEKDHLFFFGETSKSAGLYKPLCK